jgi:hypothetical protein
VKVRWLAGHQRTEGSDLSSVDMPDSNRSDYLLDQKRSRSSSDSVCGSLASDEKVGQSKREKEALPARPKKR